MKAYRKETKGHAGTCPVAKRFLVNGVDGAGLSGGYPLRRPCTLRPPPQRFLEMSAMRRSQTAPLMSSSSAELEVDAETIQEFEQRFVEAHQQQHHLMNHHQSDSLSDSNSNLNNSENETVSIFRKSRNSEFVLSTASCSTDLCYNHRTTSSTCSLTSDGSSGYRSFTSCSSADSNSNLNSADLCSNNSENSNSTLHCNNRKSSLCTKSASEKASNVCGTGSGSGNRQNRNKKDLKLYTGPGFSLSQPCLPIRDNGPTKILDHLYLGSQQDALSKETLEKHNIKYVLNISHACPKPEFIEEAKFKRIAVNDTCHEKLLPHFQQAFDFIDKAKDAKEVVLVHCLAGISRSPTLAIAYVMRTKGLSYEDAYRYVKDRRPCISPNFNFLGQLLEFEKQLAVQSPSSKAFNPEKPVFDPLEIRLPSPIFVRGSDVFNFTKLGAAVEYGHEKHSGGGKFMRRSSSAPLKNLRSSVLPNDKSALRLNFELMSPDSVRNENGKRKIGGDKRPIGQSMTVASSAFQAVDSCQNVDNSYRTENHFGASLELEVKKQHRSWSSSAVEQLSYDNDGQDCKQPSTTVTSSEVHGPTEPVLMTIGPACHDMDNMEVTTTWSTDYHPTKTTIQSDRPTSKPTNGSSRFHERVAAILNERMPPSFHADHEEPRSPVEALCKRALRFLLRDPQWPSNLQDFENLCVLSNLYNAATKCTPGATGFNEVGTGLETVARQYQDAVRQRHKDKQSHLASKYWTAVTQLSAAGDNCQQLLENLAQQGYAYAQHQLGLAYASRKDYGSALEWYRKAAVQDDVVAQCLLGELYATGLGTGSESSGTVAVPDEELARYWFQKPAEMMSPGEPPSPQETTETCLESCSRTCFPTTLTRTSHPRLCTIPSMSALDSAPPCLVMTSCPTFDVNMVTSSSIDCEVGNRSNWFSEPVSAPIRTTADSPLFNNAESNTDANKFRESLVSFNSLRQYQRVSLKQHTLRLNSSGHDSLLSSGSISLSPSICTPTTPDPDALLVSSPSESDQGFGSARGEANVPLSPRKSASFDGLDVFGINSLLNKRASWPRAIPCLAGLSAATLFSGPNSATIVPEDLRRLENSLRADSLLDSCFSDEPITTLRECHISTHCHQQLNQQRTQLQITRQRRDADSESLGSTSSLEILAN